MAQGSGDGGGCPGNRGTSIELDSGTAIRWMNRVITLLSHCGYIQKECIDQLLGEAFPKYSLGVDPLYKRDLLKNVHELVFAGVTGKDDAPPALHTMLFSAAQALMRGGPLLPSTAETLLGGSREGETGALGVIWNMLSLYALLGLTNNEWCELGVEGKWKALQLGGLQVKPDHIVIKDSLSSQERIGLSIGRWTQDLISGGRGPSDTSSTNMVQGIPGHIWDWIKNTKPAMARYILNPVLLSRKWDASQLSKLTQELIPNLGGVTIYQNSLRLTPPTLADLEKASGYKGRGWVRTYLAVRVRGHKHRRYLKALNRLFPPVSATDSRHQTLHIADWTWDYLQRGEGTPGQRLRELNSLLKWIPVGTAQPLTLGLLMACLGHSAGAVIASTYLQSGILVRDVRTQRSALKEVGTLVRKCGVDLMGNELSAPQCRALAYYDLLSGRAVHTTDWVEEEANRCRYALHLQPPKLTTRLVDGHLQFDWRSDEDSLSPDKMMYSPSFYSKLRRTLMTICEPLVTSRNTRENMSDFYRRRHEWMASGSSGGFKLKLNPTASKKLKTDTIRASKRAWAESTSLAQVIEELYVGKPKEVAHASEKYENGKARAIYGVEPMHYVINTYATKGFEERLHMIDGLEKGAAGPLAAALEQRRALQSGDKDVECTMLDYADFNRHHTPRAQAVLFEVFAALGKRVGANPDWIRANYWVAEAKRDMRAVFPHKPNRQLRVHQGMFSGTRSTDLINTLLNLAYFKVAQDYLAGEGLTAAELYHTHQGDDVWISNRNRVWARGLYYSLNAMGFLFQESKQMFGQGRGEYLRVLYIDGTGGGYLARAIANYITRPLQQNASLDPVGWARTIREGCALLSRRGMMRPMLQAIYRNGMQFWARARAHRQDKAPVSIPQATLQWDMLHGGLGCAPPHSVIAAEDLLCSYQLPQVPKFISGVDIAALGLPSKMTDDWVAAVSKRTPPGAKGMAINVAAIARSAQHHNYSVDIQQLVRDRGWDRYKRDWAKYRDQVRDDARCPRLLLSGDGLDCLMKAAGLSNDPRPTAGAELPDIRAVFTSPALAFNLANISAGDTDNSRAMSDIPGELSKIIAKSQFRSETTYAQANGISRHDAIIAILQLAGDRGELHPDVGAILLPLLLKGERSLVNYVLGEVGDLCTPMADWSNVTMWQYFSNQYISCLCQGLLDNFGMSQVRYREVMWSSWQSWLVILAHADTPLFKVVY